VASGEPSESIDALALRARVRTLKIGVWPTLFVCGVLLVYCVWTWDEPHRTPLIVLLVFTCLSTVALARVPIERLVRGRWREPFFLSWSGGLVATITAAAALDGGSSSTLALMFFLPLVYTALSYPLPSMVAIAALTVGAFGGLAWGSGEIGTPYTLVFCGALVCGAWMCAWQAQNLDTQRRELARMSRTDWLTGALNRRGFEERLEIELADARRRGAPLALALIDLDHFKEINDTRGHAAGDELLCWVVGSLREGLRARDTIGRLGGDEFALLLDDDDAGARATVARLLGGLAPRARASAGVASYPNDGAAPHRLHTAADAELYARKHARGGTPASRELSWAAAVASAVDERMAVKHAHSVAVTQYAAAIAEARGWEGERLELLRVAAMLHDVGKICIPEHVLRKPGRLTDEEFAQIAEHPTAGADIVRRIDGLAGIADWIAHSHERVDGTGYPDGLSGTEIPEASRILLVADAYDAMTSDRAYREALTAGWAREELRRNAGTQFDPDCVAALEAHLDARLDELPAPTEPGVALR
jgi:diguanylate cyclase (GGDEF)-like protein/putative nucleotidyltransferase with HDIG domain